MVLDLNRIEAWTREMLEAEARRRRIRSPEFRTRGELIRLILKHQYGARWNAGRERVAKGIKSWNETRDLVSQVVTSTLSSIPDPLGALRRLRGQLLERPASEAPPFAHSDAPTPSYVEPAAAARAPERDQRDEPEARASVAPAEAS